MTDKLVGKDIHSLGNVCACVCVQYRLFYKYIFRISAEAAKSLRNSHLYAFT